MGVGRLEENFLVGSPWLYDRTKSYSSLNPQGTGSGQDHCGQ